MSMDQEERHGFITPIAYTKPSQPPLRWSSCVHKLQTYVRPQLPQSRIRTMFHHHRFRHWSNLSRCVHPDTPSGVSRPRNTTVGHSSAGPARYSGVSNFFRKCQQVGGAVGRTRKQSTKQQGGRSTRAHLNSKQQHLPVFLRIHQQSRQ